MKRKLIKGAWVVSMDPALGDIRNGEVLIDWLMDDAGTTEAIVDAEGLAHGAGAVVDRPQLLDGLLRQMLGLVDQRPGLVRRKPGRQSVGLGFGQDRYRGGRPRRRLQAERRPEAQCPSP